MAHIALIVDDYGPQKKNVLASIRRETSLPLGEILARAPRKEPVHTLNLFGADLRDRAIAFKAFVNGLAAAGASVSMFQLLEGETLPASSSVALQVDLTMLDTMLRAHDREESYHQAIQDSKSQVRGSAAP